MRDDNKLYSVHFLRFVAAVVVLIGHVTARYKSTNALGASGVDLFFVISGLVIGLSVLSSEAPGKFAIKRIIRIYPIYWIATITYAVFRVWAWGFHPSLVDIAGSAVIFPVFGANWHPIYWPAWTLEYEITFYAVATLLLVAFRQRAFLMCTVLLVSLALMPIQNQWTSPPRLFGFLRFLEFAGGLLIAYTVRARLIADKRIGAALILIACGLLFAHRSLTMYPQALAWGIPMTMLILGTLAFEKSSFFRNRLFKLGGDASYSIYLFHVTAIEFVSVVTQLYGFNPDSLDPFGAVIFGVVSLAAALILGIAVHLCIEKPILHLLRSRLLETKKQKVLVAG